MRQINSFFGALKTQICADFFVRRLTLLFLCALFSANIVGRDLHFIYVRFDNSMDAEKLKTQIETLITRFSGSDYIVYYSNENTTMDNRSWDKNRLFGLISSQNSSIAISIPDELESISAPLETQLQEKAYNAIYFQCFVGNGFIDNNFHNTLLARMLIVNSLLRSRYRVSILYYPGGAFYTEEQIKFNPEYNINVSTKIISTL